ncbi:enoyl-CoA hydratase-related protein [Beijerinckia sp. L45]|uniref:enoyl-CoA hydratase-related protein n=1 Tax=Beijerinckia sp. L45 TaxID=1641855 RepID=UPI00131D98ED|nr:enoyl-CoA hydratase-related protein [Beijerinckia sp. L45]
MGHIAEARTGAVLAVTIARPDKKNALTNAMYGELADTLERARHDPSVRCVLITAAGDTFTAGNDLGDFAAIAAGALDRADMQVHRFLAALSTFEKPIVAAVPGLAVGIGTTMLLHCDLVVLSETATLSVPFVDLALVPEAASSLLLQARIGYVQAFAMFALGERIDAHTAMSWGLANRVVPPDELMSQAMAAATMLADKPPGALAQTKRLMRDAEAIAGRMKAEMVAFEDRLKSPEAREAFAAFAERRKPDFSGF